MRDPVQPRFKFGPFCVDSDKRMLTNDNRAVRLPPKSFDTLLFLIENRERVLEKDELIKLLWPDTFVEEINLTVHISKLRKILGEGPDDHQYIITIPKRGYRFVAAVEETSQNGIAPAEPPLINAGNGNTTPLANQKPEAESQLVLTNFTMTAPA